MAAGAAYSPSHSFSVCLKTKPAWEKLCMQEAEEGREEASMILGGGLEPEALM